MAKKDDDRPLYVKRWHGAPEGFFATEAAGLQWLAEARGARVVPVVDRADDALLLERLTPVRPMHDHALEFGRALARTHAAGAEGFGALPPEVEQFYFGPTVRPIPLPSGMWERFGEFYADARLAPILALCRDDGVVDAPLASGVERVCADLREGRWDSTDGGAGPDEGSVRPDGGSAAGPVRPARIHGDLWSGNVVWTADGVVLIDPAAHGGHPEADLAMLHLFGIPHLDAIVAGYDAVSPPVAGRVSRVPLHQLFPLLVHALLFGRGYVAPTRAAVEALVG